MCGLQFSPLPSPPLPSPILPSPPLPSPTLPYPTLLYCTVLQYPGVVVPMVLPGSEGERAGLQAGDIILSVEGHPVPASPNAVENVVGLIRDSPGQTLHLTVDRRGISTTTPTTTPAAPTTTRRASTMGVEDGYPSTAVIEVDVTPSATLDGGRIGVQLASNAEPRRVPLSSIFDVMGAANQVTQIAPPHTHTWPPTYLITYLPTYLLPLTPHPRHLPRPDPTPRPTLTF